MESETRTATDNICRTARSIAQTAMDLESYVLKRFPLSPSPPCMEWIDTAGGALPGDLTESRKIEAESAQESNMCPPKAVYHGMTKSQVGGTNSRSIGKFNAAASVKTSILSKNDSPALMRNSMRDGINCQSDVNIHCKV